MTDTTKYHHDLRLGRQLTQMTENLDMDTHRIALVLSTNGATYFVSKILQEWDNAIQFQPEGVDLAPVLVMKNCIESMKVMDRPMPRSREG